jgi:Kelch motif protein
MLRTLKRVTKSLKCRFVPLFLCFGAGYAPFVMGQSPGTFTAAGNMITPRFFHTATLLLDSRVLIAGGDSSYSAATNAEASAELYDPITGTFVATGSMTTPRDSHTATGTGAWNSD